MKFKVSIIIPVYKAEKFIAKTVESAFQLPEVKEVLLIEDGSPDNALEVCQQLVKQHSKIKLLQHPDKSNHGASASRNLGLANATCPYIAFLDADDFYLPHRFNAEKKIFAENPDADGVYNALGVHFYSQKAREMFHNARLNELTTVTEPVNPIQLFESFLAIGPYYGHFHLDGLTIKRSVLKKLDYWFKIDLKLHQDTEFIVRLLYSTNLVPGEIQMPVALRGVHEENRITQAYLDIEQTKQNKKLVWSSLFAWACANQIPEQYLEQIYKRKNDDKLLQLSTTIANNKLLQSQLAERDAQLAERGAQLADIYSSKAWKIGLRLRQIRLQLAPPGSLPAKIGAWLLSLISKDKK
jgi:glycosyltransferase involved in cell wall biosynthesis